MSLDFNRLTSRINRWLNHQQQQALERAYSAARAIQALEEQYFQGGKIAYHTSQSKTVFDYVKSLRDRQLLRVRVNLAQVQLGGFLFNHQSLNPDPLSQSAADPQPATAADQTVSADVVATLNFIESVVGKYREPDDEVEQWMVATTHADTAAMEPRVGYSKKRSPVLNDSGSSSSPESPKQLGFLRNRFLDFKAERDPDYEQRVVQELRLRRQQNKIAVCWLLILLLLPIVVQIVVKNFVFEPVLGNYSDKNPTRVELNQEIQERFFSEFTALKERLEISQLLGTTPELSNDEQRERLQEGAVELWREAREQELNGLKNVLSDGVALLAFAGLVYFNRDRIAAIRSFSNRTFLGLSDPAKVFLFILVTDMFVGFHSAEGWEVLLESVARHFGLPESRAAINTFIATVPVVLDSCIKFWIFSYLTRYSPSASAIYERMNT